MVTHKHGEFVGSFRFCDKAMRKKTNIASCGLRFSVKVEVRWEATLKTFDTKLTNPHTLVFL